MFEELSFFFDVSIRSSRAPAHPTHSRSRPSVDRWVASIIKKTGMPANSSHPFSEKHASN